MAQRIGTADTALLFGGADAEGVIGDWYLSSGVVQAIIDDVGPRPDLVAVLSGSTALPIQSQIAATGGAPIDVGRVGGNDDQVPQTFLVGGASGLQRAVREGQGCSSLRSVALVSSPLSAAHGRRAMEESGICAPRWNDLSLGTQVVCTHDLWS